MKIEFTNTIRLNSSQSEAKGAGTLTNGAELPVTVTRRLSPHHAVLEMNGKQLTAEFTHGVPLGRKLLLKVEKAGGDSLQFKLIDTSDKKGFFERVFDYTLISRKDLESSQLPIFPRLTGRTLQGIYELNLLFYKNDAHTENQTGKRARILNSLMSRGAPINVLQLLSILMSDHLPRPEMQALISFMGNQRKVDEKNISNDEEIENILNELDSFINSGDIHDIVQCVQDVLEKKSDNDYYKGESVVLDDERFTTIRYQGNSESFILSFELSLLGIVEVVFKKTDSAISLLIIADGHDAEHEIKKTIDSLHTSLSTIFRNVYINIHNRHTVIDKINLLYEYYSINHALDMKV